MNSPKNYILVFLALAVAATAAWSVYQYRELIALRAQLADGDNATLKKQLADARKAIKTLEDRIAALRGRRGFGEADGSDLESPDAAATDRGRRGGRFGAWAELAANPDFQKLMALQNKGRITQTYAALFKALNLSPEQLAQFQSLLAEKQQSLMDVMQAAREQGINPREDPDGFKALVNQAVSQVDTSIQQALGDAGYQQYQQFQATLPERNVVGTLTQSLSFTQTPLTDDEANQMIQLLADNQPQRAGNGTAGASTGGNPGPSLMSLMNGGGNARVTDAAVTAAQGVLSQPQLAALQQIQQQQQAQQQIQQMFRNANQGAGAGGAPTSGQPASGGSTGKN